MRFTVWNRFLGIYTFTIPLPLPNRISFHWLYVEAKLFLYIDTKPAKSELVAPWVGLNSSKNRTWWLLYNCQRSFLWWHLHTYNEKQEITLNIHVLFAIRATLIINSSGVLKIKLWLWYKLVNLNKKLESNKSVSKIRYLILLVLVTIVVFL